MARRPEHALPATVVALGLVSFLTDFSSEMIYPLLPVFLVQTLGAGAVALGIIEGVAETTAALLKIASGWMADRLPRRKPLVVAGYGVSGAARPLIGLAAAWPVVLLLRFFDRVGKGVRTAPRDALIADVTHPARRGASFGFHRAMDHAGAVVGPLVAAALLALPFMSLRRVFLLAAVPAVVVMVVLWLMVREPQPTPRSTLSPSHDKGPRDLGPDFKRLLVALTIFALGNSSDAFLLLRFAELGASPARLAVLWAGFHVVKSISSWLGGRLSDRRGRRALVIIGWGLYASVYLCFAALSSPGALAATFLAYGLYFGLTEPVERAWVAAIAPARLRGTAFGLYNGAIGLAALPASLLFGFLYAVVGSSAAFVTGAALAVVAALLLTRVSDPR